MGLHRVECQCSMCVCTQCRNATPGCVCLKASGGPFVAWFNRDDKGNITGAGVDNEGREAGICNMLLETITYDDPEKFNSLATGDTLLLAAAWEMRELLYRCQPQVSEPLQREIEQLRQRLMNGELTDAGGRLLS